MTNLISLDERYKRISGEILQAALGKNDAWYHGWGTDEATILKSTQQIFAIEAASSAVPNTGDQLKQTELEAPHTQLKANLFGQHRILFLKSFEEVLRTQYPKTYQKLLEQRGEKDLFETLILVEGNNSFLNNPDLETSLAIWRNSALKEKNQFLSRDGIQMSGWRFTLDKFIPDISDTSWKSIGLGFTAIGAGVAAAFCIPLELSIISVGLFFFVVTPVVLYPMVQWWKYHNQPSELSRRQAYESLGETGQNLALTVIVGAGMHGIAPAPKVPIVDDIWMPISLPSREEFPVKEIEAQPTEPEPTPSAKDATRSPEKKLSDESTLARVDELFPDLDAERINENRFTLPASDASGKFETGYLEVANIHGKYKVLFFYEHGGRPVEVTLSESIPPSTDSRGRLILTTENGNGQIVYSQDGKILLNGKYQ